MTTEARVGVQLLNRQLCNGFYSFPPDIPHILFTEVTLVISFHCHDDKKIFLVSFNNTIVKMDASQPS